MGDSLTAFQTNRRRLSWAVGLLSLLAGAALGYRVLKRPDWSEEARASLWRHRFELIDGQSLAADQFKGRPLVLNFWATWCPPCIEEMPLLDAFYARNAANGWQMIGIAIDQPASVRRYLNQRPVGYPIALGALDGVQLAAALGNPGGALPFTVVVSGRGDLLMRKLGQLSADDVNRWV